MKHEIKIGDIWYRAEGRYIDSGYDTYAGMEIDIQEWTVVRLTPCGAWLKRQNYWHRKEKFALSSGARWVSRTKKQAVENLIHRKKRQLTILRNHTTVAQDTLHAAEDELKKLEIEV